MKKLFTATLIYFFIALLICFTMDLITKGDFLLSFKTLGPEIMVLPFVIIFVFILHFALAQLLKIKKVKANRFKSAIGFTLALNFLIALALHSSEYKDFWTTFCIMLPIFSIPFLLTHWVCWLRTSR